MRWKINRGEFFDLIIVFLLDKINNEEKLLPQDERFNEIVKKMRQLKGTLIGHYLDLDVKTKKKYKKLRKVFIKENLSQKYTIQIIDNYENTDIEESTENIYIEPSIKEIIKKSVNMLLQKRFKTGKYITENDIENVITKILNEKEL